MWPLVKTSLTALVWGYVEQLIVNLLCLILFHYVDSFSIFNIHFILGQTINPFLHIFSLFSSVEKKV